MYKLDLHGVRHHEVEHLVEDFILLNQKEFPLEIVCGNSEKMIQLVQKVIKKLKCDWHMYRYGIIVVRQWT